MNNDLKTKINRYSEENDTDIISYTGPIVIDGYIALTIELAKRRLRKNVLLILSTYGGSPDIAYKIARHFQNRYSLSGGLFKTFITGSCKSAGTLLCLGATAIVMGDNAELGPLDIQLRKREEVGERASGLLSIQALQSLQIQSMNLYSQHFQALRQAGFSTKLASEKATQITTGLMGPIYQQIDPLRLAEEDRSLRITRDYGARLTRGNLKEHALNHLMGGYPSHEFVIDREEAGRLFNNVELPSQDLSEIGGIHYGLNLMEGPVVAVYSLEPSNIVDLNKAEEALQRRSR